MAKPVQEWIPRTLEDRMLLAYAQRKPGLIFAEVPIGGRGGKGEWPAGSTFRRLDGVRFVRRSPRPARVGRFKAQEAAYLGGLNSEKVELIEVKPALNRGAIGQVVAARAMFGRQYRVTIERAVVICLAGRSDPALAWVCGQEGISVEEVEVE